MSIEQVYERFFAADPDLAEMVKTGLEKKNSPLLPEETAMLVEETIHGLSIEYSFGQAVAMGFVELFGEVDLERIVQYRDLVRGAAAIGPTFGKLMAVSLVPVIRQKDKRLLETFLKAVDIMEAKGTYTLRRPLETLSILLINEEFEAGSSFLELLVDTFKQDLSYNQSLNFTHILPKAVQFFTPSKRPWHIEALRKVINTDFHLAEPLLEGIKAGLYLLSKEALGKFISSGLKKFCNNKKMGIKFLSLESKIGIDTYKSLQVTVSISQVQQRLAMYLKARVGRTVGICPISSIPKSFLKERIGELSVCSDGKFIYLPDEVSLFSSKEKNADLYKCLAKFEAGQFEFNTFNFDLEKAATRYSRLNAFISCKTTGIENYGNDKYQNFSDLERFFSYFPVKSLASDLFTIFEHGRLRVLLSRHYPGLVNQYIPMLELEAKRILKEKKLNNPLFFLYIWISIGNSVLEKLNFDEDLKRVFKKFSDLFEEKIEENNDVELSADMVFKTYHFMEKLLKRSSGRANFEKHYQPLIIPFGRRLIPELIFSAYRNYEDIAKRIKTKIEDKGIKIYKSDIKKSLIKNNGEISPEDIKEIILRNQKQTHPDKNQRQEQQIEFNPSNIDFSKLFDSPDTTEFLSDTTLCPVYWYKEWDKSLGDYLPNHVRVLDKTIDGIKNDFYSRALNRHKGLVKRLRYSFDLLKPEGLSLLRHWVEGDEFDYRALLDFAVDKKIGIMPSDRLYIKRIKEQRDVAVLLLVDLSHSTSNKVFGSGETVLELEREAIVLFCEALQVVGDTFAIAGFSGTGRLGVDYFRIKDFNQKLDENVKERINALKAQRSTRMGAAIRHASSQLEAVSSKVRLMMIIGDGFPNDSGYKQDYAIEDTHRAITEARAKNIYTKAITVNIVGDSKLDELYGSLHHNIIADVRELPDKLLRIYRSLTRN